MCQNFSPHLTKKEKLSFETATESVSRRPHVFSSEVDLPLSVGMAEKSREDLATQDNVNGPKYRERIFQTWEKKAGDSHATKSPHPFTSCHCSSRLKRSYHKFWSAWNLYESCKWYGKELTVWSIFFGNACLSFFYQFVRNMQGMLTFYNYSLCALVQRDGGFLSLKMLKYSQYL